MNWNISHHTKLGGDAQRLTSIRNSLPDSGLIHDHLWGVKYPAVRGLIQELQWSLRLIALPDPVSGVDDCVCGAEIGQIVVFPQHSVIGIVVFAMVVMEFESLFHVDEDVLIGVILESWACQRALDDVHGLRYVLHSHP